MYENNNENYSSPNFDILSLGTLRRYQSFFDLKMEDMSVGSTKDEIVKLIKNHFENKLEVDNDKIIETFLKIEKDQTNDKNNTIRKSNRFQEKNLVKIMENFNK
jgi:hypothetical protein